MSNLKVPKKWLNATLFYLGCFGVVFHLTATIYGLWVGLGVITDYWWTWPAPIVCILWGILPPLQLQAERPSNKRSSTFEV
ncbi:MAG: hypothetical protein KJ930_12570 [Gammaproteobacteria bacterium]|nr:hypothetical protein [Gammaproteobacteria bacterium]MBU2180254.1 hypothetical protein [Gammaproteobacteria bacterium]MBU2224161.1 hypothetical protein [Gammaproteobacteria bacterium]MBU2277468.1 hypothetical protein [Gammaproteobacteria bacterium]